MGIAAFIPFIDKIFGVVDEVIEDKDEANKIKAMLQTKVLEQESDFMKAASSIIVAEAKGGSWLQRNWRPVLMLVCIIIVANNYILAPYVSLIFGVDVSLDLDQNIWDLMKLGVGGYITSRGVEKTAKIWKEKD